MAKQLVIQDVADVILTDISTGKVMANTYMQISGLSGTINEEDLRAGIGNGKIFKIRSDKDLELNFTSAVYDADWLAMTQGVELESDKEVVITRAVRKNVGEDGTVEIEGVEANIEEGSVVANLDGVIAEDVSIEGLTVTVGLDYAGQDVTVSYKEKVTGNSIEFDSAKFSRKVRVDMRTIAYDLDTAEIHSDIYFVFPEAMSGGDFDLSFSAGEVITPEMTFSVLQPKGTTVMGEMVEVPRVKEDDTP